MADQPIQHIVLYSIATKEDLDKTMHFVTSMPQTAKRNGNPYILEARCGEVIQHEPIRDGGYNLASVLTFRNEEDRIYFVKDDPVHVELKSMIGGRLNRDVMVLDFVSGC